MIRHETDYYVVKATVLLEGGIHARPTRDITEIVRAYDGKVKIRYEDVEADANDPISLMCIAAERGSEIEIKVERGRGCERVAEGIIKVISDTELKPEL